MDSAKALRRQRNTILHSEGQRPCNLPFSSGHLQASGEASLINGMLPLGVGKSLSFEYRPDNGIKFCCFITSTFFSSFCPLSIGKTHVKWPSGPKCVAAVLCGFLFPVSDQDAESSAHRSHCWVAQAFLSLLLGPPVALTP